MFKKTTGSKKSSKSLSNLPIDTVIAAGITIQGDIIGEGAIRVDGSVQGNIQLDKGIILGEKGEITGSVKSGEVIIYGTLNGNLECKELFIKESGEINGDILVNTFSVDMGGRYNGNLKMTTNEISINREGKSAKKSAEN